MTLAGRMKSTMVALILQSILVKHVQPFRSLSGMSRQTVASFKLLDTCQAREGWLCELQLRRKHKNEQRTTRLLLSSSSSLSSSSTSGISESDEDYLQQAIQNAKLGLGYTYPNPAVGCVLVRQDTNEVVGSGFHPRSGEPHAEVFALLEAKGHVSSGIEAAKSVMKRGNSDNSNDDIAQTVRALADKYTSPGGPEELFEPSSGDSSAKENPDSIPVTAYVTLEPCCHFGRTPPCAKTFVISKNVERVVVGFRDPNPKVDGGGVKLLQDAGIQVDMAEVGSDVHKECADITKDFVKRITAPSPHNYEELINGAMRRGLRSLANRKKNDDSLSQHNWVAKGVVISNNNASDEDIAELIDSLPLDPTWIEELDSKLWENELVQLKLNKAIKKKKWAKRLGNRIGKELDAHVAQTVGHSVLLYRPGMPPVLDLQQLVRKTDEE